jgi:hypothetical protein
MCAYVQSPASLPSSEGPKCSPVIVTGVFPAVGPWLGSILVTRGAIPKLAKEKNNDAYNQN